VRGVTREELNNVVFVSEPTFQATLTGYMSSVFYLVIIMFGFLKKKAGNVQAEIKRVENRDLMEAIVGGCLLVAAADGSIDDEELLTLDKSINANPSMQHFGAEIGKTINLFEQQLSAGFRIGKMKILREIADIKNTPADAEEVFVNMITVAEADGEIDDKELAILKEVGQTLGVRLSDFGIE